METIWDHNPTDAELVAMFFDLENAERARREGLSPDTERFKLACLFDSRGRIADRDRVVASIEDEQYRFDSALYFAEEA